MNQMRTLGKIAHWLRRDPEGISILATYWGIPLAIAAGYFTPLRGGRAAGAPSLESFSIYLSQISTALTPYSIPVLSILTFYLYLRRRTHPTRNLCGTRRRPNSQGSPCSRFTSA